MSAHGTDQKNGSQFPFVIIRASQKQLYLGIRDDKKTSLHLLIFRSTNEFLM